MDNLTLYLGCMGLGGMLAALAAVVCDILEHKFPTTSHNRKYLQP